MADNRKDDPIEKGQPGKNFDTEKDVPGKSGMGQDREDSDVEDLGRKQGQTGNEDIEKQSSSEDKGYTRK